MMEYIRPKTYCEKWPDGCLVCDLELCDGKKETAKMRLEKEYLHETTGVIICGFPGVGKSTVAANRTDIVDAESSGFSHPFNPETGQQEADPKFPLNYVEHLKQLASRLGGYQYVLASCHKEVRDELEKQEIPFVVVVPSCGCKDEYMARYLKRGDSAEFIGNVYIHWQEWLDEIESRHQPVIHLTWRETLADILPKP